MQISNSGLSQFVSNTKLNQYANRPSNKPVTIEGQLDDEKTDSAEKKTTDSALALPETGSQTQLVLPPSTPAAIPYEVNSDKLRNNKLQTGEFKQDEFKQDKFKQEVTSTDDLSRSPSTGESSATLEHSFPYANRKSFRGLAGNPLVIQNYLNNESQDSAQSGNLQTHINFFV